MPHTLPQGAPYMEHRIFSALHEIFYKVNGLKWLRKLLPSVYIFGVMSKTKNSAHGAPLFPTNGNINFHFLIIGSTVRVHTM